MRPSSCFADMEMRDRNTFSCLFSTSGLAACSYPLFTPRSIFGKNTPLTSMRMTSSAISRL